MIRLKNDKINRKMTKNLKFNKKIFTIAKRMYVIVNTF